MNTSELALVPLQQASLCLDCDMITAAQTHCFACGSVALMNLARTLNGCPNAGPVRPELFLMRKNSVRPKQPGAFNAVPADRNPGLKAKCADLRKVLSTVLIRPVRDALAMRYGN
jgi:hypothetical protein